MSKKQEYNIEELSKHEFVVIGSEHYNPLGVIRSLGEAGIAPIAVIRRGEYGFASASKYIKQLFLIDDYEESLDIIKRFGDIDCKPVIIPCDDVITLICDREYAWLRDICIVSNAGEPGRLAFYAQKKNQIELASKIGLNVAKTWIVEGTVPDDIEYPIITKPTYSYDNWKEDYYICRNEQELLDAYDEVKGEVFLQQYIQKDTKICFDGVVVDHGKSMLAAIQSTYTYALPDYYSSEMIVSNPDDPELQAQLNRMFETIGYEGIFEVEFMRDMEGKLWFLEVNFRNSTWSYAATKLGMNLPVLFAEGSLAGVLPKDARKPIPEGYVAVAELMDFLQRVMKYKMISPLKWLRGVLKADCRYFYNSADKKPFFSICAYQVKKILLRRS